MLFAEASIERLRGQGTTILVRSCDVAVREQVDELLGEIRATMPPLRGVMHAAGVLDDGALLDLTPARLAAVLAPKVLGSVHWHAATLGESLDRKSTRLNSSHLG